MISGNPSSLRTGNLNLRAAFVFLALSALLLASCSLSPRYERPETELPAAFKREEGWQTARPRDGLAKGPWWKIFEDPTLNRLMDELNAHNNQLAVAAANLRLARAQVYGARSAFFPSARATGSVARNRDALGTINSTYSAGFSANWEIGFWNSIPAYQAIREQTRATAADYATMRLALQAELAGSYFRLRTLDSQIDLYNETIKAYEKAVALTKSQYKGGMVTMTDVAQAETQLAQAESSKADLDRQRALVENAIAVLTGRTPSEFYLEAALPPDSAPPEIPGVLPSELLERRPDVAAAERQAAAANEQIGVARAAWFPSLNLSLESISIGPWLGATTRTWTMGPNASLSLFEGGRRLAENEGAWAAYEAAVGVYRQTALVAFQDVEDALANIVFLREQAAAQDRAVLASQTALRLAISQYQGGVTTYLQVVDSQTAALQNERLSRFIRGERLAATVDLIKALGGGWTEPDMEEMAFGGGPTEPAAARPDS